MFDIQTFKVRGCLSGFWYPLLMFCLEAFLFTSLFPLLLGFQSKLIVFYSILMGIFEKLLGLGPLECPKALLIHQQVALPISSGGIGFISLEFIVLAIYLGSWALITLVIASKFLLDSHSFLLEAIGVSNLWPFPFQAHLKLTQELGATTCVPSLKQLVKRSTYHLQENFQRDYMTIPLLASSFIYLLICIKHA